MSYHGKLQVLKNGTADAEIQLWAYQQIETIEYLYKKHDEQQAEIEALKATIGKITISSNLTDEEIDRVWYEDCNNSDSLIEFARAILRKASKK